VNLTIYGIPKSRTMRTIWLAGELGIPYELKEKQPGTDDPWYRPINPNRKVPSIDADGFTLWESMAINIYLAKKHGSPLIGKTLEDEADVLRWTFFAVTEVEQKQLELVVQRLLLPPDRRDARRDAEAVDALKRPYGVLDQQLSQHAYLRGAEFSLADLNVAGVLYSVRVMSFDLSGFPHLDAWLTRCLDRPAAKHARSLRGGP
jgi:glutathione S-transferase